MGAGYRIGPSHKLRPTQQKTFAICYTGCYERAWITLLQKRVVAQTFPNRL